MTDAGRSSTRRQAGPAEASPAGSETLADRVVAAALSVPTVVAVSGSTLDGTFDTVATYLPGRTIPGVRIDEDRVELHIEVSSGAPITDTVHNVGLAVHQLLSGRRLDVTIDDILLPDETGPAGNDAPEI